MPEEMLEDARVGDLEETVEQFYDEELVVFIVDVGLILFEDICCAKDSSASDEVEFV